VIKERRTQEVQDIQMPGKCPSCGWKVKNEDIHYYCTNPKCPAKLKEQILHFVSKNCMDIQWIWESIVDILVEQNIVQGIADIYRIPEHTTQILLRKFPGIGDKKISEIANEIEESKHQPLRRLLNGLWIPHVGKKMAQDIVQAMVSQQPVCLEDILYILTDRDFLITVYGIGDKTLDALVDYFSDTEHQEMLMHLRDIGMKFTVDAGGYDLFKEKKETFSITGTFPVSRENIVTVLEKEGYIFHDIPQNLQSLCL
jgi:DNA ligase (NAD+)